MKMVGGIDDVVLTTIDDVIVDGIDDVVNDDHTCSWNSQQVGSIRLYVVGR